MRARECWYKRPQNDHFEMVPSPEKGHSWTWSSSLLKNPELLTQGVTAEEFVYFSLLLSGVPLGQAGWILRGFLGSIQLWHFCNSAEPKVTQGILYFPALQPFQNYCPLVLIPYLNYNFFIVLYLRNQHDSTKNWWPSEANKKAHKKIGNLNSPPKTW